MINSIIFIKYSIHSLVFNMIYLCKGERDGDRREALRTDPRHQHRLLGRLRRGPQPRLHQVGCGRRLPCLDPGVQEGKLPPGTQALRTIHNNITIILINYMLPIL